MKLPLMILLTALLSMPISRHHAAQSLSLYIAEEKWVASQRAIIKSEMEAELKEKLECNLGFQSNNDGWVEPSEELMGHLDELSECRDKKVAMRIAQYESTLCANKTTSLSYASGCFMIIPSTRKFCHDNGVHSDVECAVWVFDNYRSWYNESVGANMNSFVDLIY